MPAAWLVAVGEKNSSSIRSAGRAVRPTNDLLDLRRERRHAFATRRTGACENESPDKLGGIQSDLLSDHSSDREPEDIHLLGAKRMDEGDDVAPHALHRVRCLATRAAYAPIVHEHHGTVLGEPVGVDGIPVVHPAGEVLEADQGRRTLLPELAIGETGIADL